ncbi:globin domain-containing protein [Corynebacterium tapiri]|uniref:nitric oxide dioxygenase n=1 Tax=Corynebacterium tapiri TaxID=1448266 RepID=A0A5C4U3Z6_9CORY|nr:globin domain-containing protein [Corynebacterium tapiri]TNL96045.1 hemin transporter [Corynebacterium tapiri]
MHLDYLPSTDTHLSPEHEELVRATLPAVGENIHTIAHTFYGKMFSAHPELLRDTFNRGNQKSGEQQKALAASVATFATMLVDENAPDPVHMLDRIAHKHVSLGIVEEQYPIVHDNLLAAVAEVLGDAVTEDVAAAWSAVYWLMADVLIKHERELYRSNDLADGDVFRTVTVAAKEQLTDNVLRLRLEGDLVAPLPGQYTSVGVKLDDGARQLRQYSIIKGDDRAYEIAVQRDGEVSAWLFDKIAQGDSIEATIAAGDLVLEEGDEDVVLISSGIGSTPMVGMLNHLREQESTRRVVVCHVDESEQTFAQRAEVRQLVDGLAGAELHEYFRAQEQRLDVTKLDLAGAHVYLCGGTNFLQGLRAQLEALPEGKRPAEVSYEMFSPNDWLLG